MYLARSGGKITLEKLTELLDAETMLTAKECMEYGVCDEIADIEVDAEQTAQMMQRMNANIATQVKYYQTLRQSFGEAMEAFKATTTPPYQKGPSPTAVLADQGSDELSKVGAIIKALPKNERKELGPRYFYDDTQYRYVKENGDELIGFVENRATGKKGHLNLAVLPAYRGKGHAKSMVDKAIESAPDIGVEKILWITTPTNEASRKLAEQCGFELVSEDEDAVKYEYLLDKQNSEPKQNKPLTFITALFAERKDDDK